MISPRLDERALGDAVELLASLDDDLGRIAARHGPPPLWPRQPGFGTLVRIILEQQISLSSAEAAYGRLERAVGTIEPRTVLQLGEAGMRGIGQTRQKSRYVAELAEAVSSGRLDVASLEMASDDEARDRLMTVPGIGRWSADVYLLLAMRRPDIWPSGDIALATAVRVVKRLSERPTPDQMVALAEAWRPWRAVAARLLWHAYLSGERG